MISTRDEVFAYRSLIFQIGKTVYMEFLVTFFSGVKFHPALKTGKNKFHPGIM